MQDIVRRVDYFSILVSNKPGNAFSVLSALVSAGVNLLACSGIPRGRRAEIDVVPDNSRVFRSAVKKAGLEFKSEKSGFLIQGDDRPGALAQNVEKLASRHINIIGIEGLSAGAGRWGAIIWVENDDLARAGRALRAKAR